MARGGQHAGACGREEAVTEATFAMVLLAVWVLCIDWVQTRWIADHPGFLELNPILGAHPSLGRVNAYFTVAIVALIAVTFALPWPYGFYGAMVVALIEVVVIARNSYLGIGLR